MSGPTSPSASSNTTAPRPTTFNVVPMDYDVMFWRQQQYGSASGKIPHFDGTHYDHWKVKMYLYLESMGYPIVKIVEDGFIFENESNPTPTDLENIRMNAQASSAIISALIPNEYSRIVGINITIRKWQHNRTST